MFERFRIKAALRVHVVELRRQGVDTDALARAELLFFEPAFLIAPEMKRRRWTADQAAVFMVTDVVLDAARQDALAGLEQEDPATFAALRAIYGHVVAKALADPALASCISRPDAGEPEPFADMEPHR